MIFAIISVFNNIFASIFVYLNRTHVAICVNFFFLFALVNEMLQTAKLFARRGNGGFDARGTALSNKHMNGLTFGEFCVLAADLKRFRTQCPQSSRKDSAYTSIGGCSNDNTSKNGSKDELKPTDVTVPPEVFLGGSCNPTTWRADVAIPTLQKLGISFYNPVSNIDIPFFDFQVKHISILL